MTSHQTITNYLLHILVSEAPTSAEFEFRTIQSYFRPETAPFDLLDYPEIASDFNLSLPRMASQDGIKDHRLKGSMSNIATCNQSKERKPSIKPTITSK